MCSMAESVSYRLETKVRELISRYESLKTENSALRGKLEALTAQLEQKTNNIQLLEQKIKNLQLTGAFLGSGGDNAAAKRKVSALIKEIDRCIAMLDE